jgi:hypothetical protein
VEGTGLLDKTTIEDWIQTNIALIKKGSGSAPLPSDCIPSVFYFFFGAGFFAACFLVSAFFAAFSFIAARAAASFAMVTL